METQNKQTKKVGYILSLEGIKLLKELSKEYRGNKSYTLDQAIKLMYNSKNNVNETSNK